MIELFRRKAGDYFKHMGIHSLPGHFRSMEKGLRSRPSPKAPMKPRRRSSEAENRLTGDPLFQDSSSSAAEPTSAKANFIKAPAPRSFPNAKIPTSKLTT